MAVRPQQSCVTLPTSICMHTTVTSSAAVHHCTTYCRCMPMLHQMQDGILNQTHIKHAPCMCLLEPLRRKKHKGINSYLTPNPSQYQVTVSSDTSTDTATQSVSVLGKCIDAAAAVVVGCKYTLISQPHNMLHRTKKYCAALHKAKGT
jgi:hypothetical protein